MAAKKAGVSLKFFHNEFVRAIDNEIRDYIVAVKNRYIRILNDMMRGPKTGRIYNVGKTPTKADRAAGRNFRSHQASAPGEAPAIDTGRLRQSIVSEITKRFPMVWEAVVGTSIKPAAGQERSYPEILEFGSAKIEPRPMWRPALEKISAEAEKRHGDE